MVEHRKGNSSLLVVDASFLARMVLHHADPVDDPSAAMRDALDRSMLVAPQEQDDRNSYCTMQGRQKGPAAELQA